MIDAAKRIACVAQKELDALPSNSLAT